MPSDVIVHSDRGSQYCSGTYQKLLKKHSLICSMSAKGNCYDDACAESFFHSLKVEVIHGQRFPTREIMRQTVFEYIEVDYNRTRRHRANGFISPEAFEAQKSRLVRCPLLVGRINFDTEGNLALMPSHGVKGDE